MFIKAEKAFFVLLGLLLSSGGARGLQTCQPRRKLQKFKTEKSRISTQKNKNAFVKFRFWSHKRRRIAASKFGFRIGIFFFRIHSTRNAASSRFLSMKSKNIFFVNIFCCKFYICSIKLLNKPQIRKRLFFEILFLIKSEK